MYILKYRKANAMKKNIWIWNHYATNMFFDRDGRHYRFAKYLREAGYNPTIFCASTIHNTDNAVKISQGIYKTDMIDGIPFIFVKTPPYQGNGLARIKNMLTFAHRVKRVAKKLPSVQKPDVILASSVHPFTCIAGILTAKTLGVPCIVEIRDLWPESIVAYQNRSRKNPAILALYQLEKWIYKKADRLVFTMEGGKDYIRERGWAKDIDLNKVRHINNGVDLEEFDDNATKYILNDTDLNNSDTFKIVYAGSIRAVNNLLPVMEAAKILQENGQKQIQFLIYGSGNELTLLRQ